MNTKIPFLAALVALAGLSTACGDEVNTNASATSSGATTSGAGGSSSASGTGGASTGAGGESTSSSTGGGAGGCVKDGSLPTPTAGVQEFTISQMIDGKSVDRRVLVQAPKSVSSDTCYPVIFILHGNGGNPDGFMKRFAEWVEDGKFIAVFPEGHLKSWNLGKEDSSADDVSFLEQAADRLGEWGNIEHDRRYAYGFSNGAGMAHKLGIESTYFRAFVAVVTSLTTANLPTSTSGTPAVMQILGELDGAIPYEGGKGVGGHEFLSGENSAKTWAEHNGCNLTPEVTTTSDGNERFAYSGCTNNADVVHYKAVGEKHNIPGTFEGGLDDLVWDFLSAH